MSHKFKSIPPGLIMSFRHYLTGKVTNFINARRMEYDIDRYLSFMLIKSRRENNDLNRTMLLLYLLFIHLGILSDDPNKPNEDPSKIPSMFSWFCKCIIDQLESWFVDHGFQFFNCHVGWCCFDRCTHHLGAFRQTLITQNCEQKNSGGITIKI